MNIYRLDRAVLVERLERLGYSIGRLGVALLKANGVVLAGQRLIKLRIGIGLGGKLILGNRKIARHGIDRAALELHKGRVVLADRVERGKRRCQILLVTLKHVLRSGISLGNHSLAGKIVPALDARILLDHQHLLVEHVRLGERVVVLTALHGKAVPDAVDGTRVEQRVLGIPVDSLILNIPTLLVGNGLGKVEVKAGVLAIVAYKAIRRIGLVKAHDELLGLRSALHVLGCGRSGSRALIGTTAAAYQAEAKHRGKRTG